MKQKLQTYLENFDKLYMFYNIRFEEDKDIFDLLDDASADIASDQIEDIGNQASSDLPEESNEDFTGGETQNTEDITEDITKSVKVLSLINKFEQLYYELMIIKAKLEKIVPNPYEFLNEIKKFENMLILLLYKLDKNNVDKIDEILEVYMKTLREYLLSLKPQSE